MTQRLIFPLRIALVLAFGFALLMQVFALPGELAETLRGAPDFAHLSVPFFVVAVLELLGLQILIVCTWRLLTMISKDRIFRKDSATWVNLIVRTIVAGWVLFAAIATYTTAVIYFTPDIRDPGTPILFAGILLVGAVLVMLVAVMRALLQQATVLRSDLDEVI